MSQRRLRWQAEPGPFRAGQIRDGDPYELSHGHPIHCMSASGRHGHANAAGAIVLASDPDVQSAGVDVGYSPDAKMLRAPDIAVGNVPDEPGWVRGAPPLAVEYFDTGQDEDQLQEKIVDLLGAGTRLVWVVRLVGPRRVEVYERDRAVRTCVPGRVQPSCLSTLLAFSRRASLWAVSPR